MRVTMDRYGADWAMVERGYHAHVHGEGRRFRSTREAILTFREEQPGVGDQNLPAFVLEDADGEPVGPMRDGASVVLSNFRGDRAIEISQALEQRDFRVFDRGGHPELLYAGMMQYDGDLGVPGRYLVEPPDIDRPLGAYLAAAGVPQLAISETQKYGHVTYFWNGNRSGCFDPSMEHYIEIPSDTLPFEERPWMKAAEISDALIRELCTGKYRHARVNYANGDMVGHTGDRDAAVQAVEAVDLQLGRLLPVIEKLRGALLVTADHGNADQMYEIDKKTGGSKLDAQGRPMLKTSHTLNKVPCYIHVPGKRLALSETLQSPGLSNVAATVLQLLGKAAPEGYAPSLLQPGL